MRASRSDARHDHKHEDHDATGHARKITEVSQSQFLMTMDTGCSVSLCCVVHVGEA